MTSPLHPSRRIVFQGMGALGVAAALAGCGGGDESAADPPATGSALATTSEVPVGGGVVNSEARVVVTQPTEGEFKAFTAICTHQSCTVTGVDETINCSCHGSRFAIDTGEPVGGPAPSALAEVAIKVEGDSIVAA